MELRTTIPQTAIRDVLSYTGFRQLVAQQLSEGRTTNDDPSPVMLDYTRLNIQRMDKWDRIFRLDEYRVEQLRSIRRKALLLTIAEGWCGDVAQVVPILSRICEMSPFLDLNILLRDRNPELMDAFLTAGARAIPKVIILDAGTREVLGTWGPRPSEAQAIVMDMKAVLGRMPEAERPAWRASFTESLHAWYARDKGRRTAAEFLDTLLPLVGEAG